MSYSTVMVQLDIDRSNDVRLRIAGDLAERFDARLIGVAAADIQPLYFMDGAAAQEMLEKDRAQLKSKMADCEAQFRRLRPKYGVYGIPGNHDLHGAGSKTFFDGAGIHLLQDTVEEIGNAFYLVGRNDGRSGGRKSIRELLRDCDRSLPIIVLDHRPTDLDNVSLSGADILLSGHTHNGQLFPVNLIAKRYYELSWGYKLKKETHVFVTSGIQVWGPPVRTAGDSEILIVNVSFREDL